MLAFELFGSSFHKFWDKALFHAIAFVSVLAVMVLCEFLGTVYRDLAWKKKERALKAIADELGVSRNKLADAKNEIYNYVSENKGMSTEHILRDVNLPAGFGFNEESVTAIQLIGLYGYGNYAQDPSTGNWHIAKSLRAAKKMSRGPKRKKEFTLR